MALLIDAAIEPRLEAAREARGLVSRVDDPALEHVIDDVALLVSELVTNSFRYGGLRADERISLVMTHESNTVRAEIADPGRGATRPRPRRPTADGGWGLEIVRRKSDRWGVEQREDGTVVWFEIDVDGGRGV
jgi:two-component sensor histidine kinase